MKGRWYEKVEPWPFLKPNDKGLTSHLSPLILEMVGLHILK